MPQTNTSFPEMSTANISAGRKINTAKFWQRKLTEATANLKLAEYKLRIAKSEVSRAKRREAEYKKQVRKAVKAAAN